MLTVFALGVIAQAPAWPDLGVAPPGRGGEADVAVIVGIESYGSLPAVPGAAQTANDWFTWLTTTVAVPATNVRLLRNNEGTLEKLRRFAGEAVSRARPESTLWFVFVGHGAPERTGSDGLLIGYDAQQEADSLSARSLAQQELLSILAKGKQRRTVVVIDACFSGRSRTGQPLVPGLQPVVLLKPLAPPKALVMTAASAEEFAGPLPGSARPAFSYLLLGALRGWGDQNHDGSVTPNEAVGWVRDALRVLVNDRVQTPELAGPQLDEVLTTALEQGPDLRALIVKGPSAPAVVLPPRISAPAASGVFDLESEQLRGKALELETDPKATPEQKAAAWCRLAKVKGPYKDVSQSACTEWTRFAGVAKGLRKTIDAELSRLTAYCALKHVGTEEKVAASERFLRTYWPLRDDQRVKKVVASRATLLVGNRPQAFYILKRSAVALPVLSGSPALEQKVALTKKLEQLMVERDQKVKEKDDGFRVILEQYERKRIDRDAAVAAELSYEKERLALLASLDFARDDLVRRERTARVAAIAEVEKLAKTAPRLVTLAELRFELALDQYDAAMHDYEASLKTLKAGDQPPPEPRIDFSPSIALHRQLLSEFPDDALAETSRYLVGYCLEKQEQFDDAKAEYEAFLLRHPRSNFVPEVNMRLGEYFFDTATDEQRSVLEQAAEHYQRAAGDLKGPLADKAAYKLAWTYYRLGDREQAVAVATRLVELYERQGNVGDLLAEAKGLMRLDFDPSR
ncbi:MAG: tetratricopeptide repeat protein [Archangiaceae bacterium]|nr:tetratricopeptide repeat protein [Archangiaceae bacterium]